MRAWISAIAVAALLAPAARPCLAAPPAQQVVLPSGAPSGDPLVDRVWVEFRAGHGVTAARPGPAVVLIHGHHAPIRNQMRPYVEAYARRGISTAVMTLPYHRERRHPGKCVGGPFVNDDARRQRQALEQAVADVGQVVTWLREQPLVDPERIGITGISLGALITHLAMGKDPRLVAGVAMLGGGNLPCVQEHRPGLVQHRLGGLLDNEELELMAPVDPMNYADENQPRQVLMFEGARDWIFPPHCVEGFWKALGRPPIIWLDAGHIVPVRIEASAARTSAAYLHSVFEGDPKPVGELPHAYVPTFKIGFIAGLGTLVTPALQWQAFTFLKRPDHMSLLHADVGVTGRGPFVGCAATLTNHVDFGVGYRFLADAVRPYFSYHLVP